MMGDTVDPLYDEIYSNLAKLMDANVTEGNRLASVLSVVGFFIYRYYHCHYHPLSDYLNTDGC